MGCKVAAVVLAAGASSRMGQPKALLRWKGRTFVEHAIGLARTSGCAPVVVVEGAHGLPDAVLAGAQRVRNPRWRDGQLSSLQAGLRALPMDVTGVLVLTVDRPHVDPGTVAALVRAQEGDPSSIWQPAHHGQRGHPLLVPRDVAEAWRLAPSTGTARDVVRLHASRRRVVDVTDPAVLENLDRPEDLERLP